jgi:hypothetical protein
VVSCVEQEPPFRVHPYKVVGFGKKRIGGVYRLEIDTGDMTCVFRRVGIQCVRKDEIGSSLDERKRIQ